MLLSPVGGISKLNRVKPRNSGQFYGHKVEGVSAILKVVPLQEEILTMNMCPLCILQVSTILTSAGLYCTGSVEGTFYWRGRH